jgi:hypothetical protein
MVHATAADAVIKYLSVSRTEEIGQGDVPHAAKICAR